MAGCSGHKNCANCLRYALAWRTSVLAEMGSSQRIVQDELPFGGAA
jgi:hypothetical protein